MYMKAVDKMREMVLTNINEFPDEYEFNFVVSPKEYEELDGRIGHLPIECIETEHLVFWYLGRKVIVTK